MSQSNKRKQNFFNISQSRVINQLLLEIDTRKTRCIVQAEFSNAGTIHSEKSDFSLDIEDITVFRWTPAEKKLLIAVLEDFYINHSAEIHIRISSFAERCGKKSIKEFRTQLKMSLNSLKMVEIPIGGERHPVPLVAESKLDHGYIVITLSSYFLKELKGNPGAVQVPCAFFEINTKQYRYASDILYYVSLMRFLNYNKEQRRDHITISKILDITALPTLAEARNSKNGSIRERIYQPFFSNLDSLGQELSYELINVAGFPVSVSDAIRMDFYDFQKICIHFKWIHETEFWKKQK